MSDTNTTEDDGIDYEKLAESMISRLQSMGLSRREMLAGLAGAGAGGIGLLSATGGASAQTTGIIYADQIGDSNEPVNELYVDTQQNFNTSEDFGSLSVTGNEIYIQDTEPTSPSQGDVWIDTSGVE